MLFIDQLVRSKATCSFNTVLKENEAIHTHKHDSRSQAGVYRIPCSCGKVYIGETGRDLTTRLKEHKAHGRKGEYDKSAIVKHSTDLDHVVDWIYYYYYYYY